MDILLKLNQTKLLNIPLGIEHASLYKRERPLELELLENLLIAYCDLNNDIYLLNYFIL